MTDLMLSAATLPLAADAIRQAAADLVPDGEPQRAINRRCSPVGLPPP